MVKSAQEAVGIAPEVLAKYEPVIGLEVHVQLLTKSKIFLRVLEPVRRCAKQQHLPDLSGLPGTLPILNKRAVEMATLASLAINCTVHEHSRFARKNYFYPDLPKGYQFRSTNYRSPQAAGLMSNTTAKEADRHHAPASGRRRRQEPARRISESATKAYIDYNRCGTPLCESSPSRICAAPERPTPT